MKSNLTVLRYIAELTLQSYFLMMRKKGASQKPGGTSYHHGNLRRSLAEAAEAILEEEGLDALSLRAVARRAGVSQAAPYHHFADKDALLGSVAGYGFQKLRDAMSEAAKPCADPLGGLQNFGLAYIRFAQKHTALFRLMFTRGTVIPAPEEATPQDGVVDDLTIEGICKATGCTREQAKRINLLLWSCVHGLTMLWLDNQLGAPDSIDLEQKTREITDLLGPVLQRVSTTSS